MPLLGNDVSPAVARYLWHADSDDFDVMHAHSHCYFVTNLAALKRRLGDIPLAITNHGLYSQNASERLFSLYLKSSGGGRSIRLTWCSVTPTWTASACGIWA